MNEANSINCLSPDILENNKQLMKEFILQNNNQSYKLTVSSFNKYLNFKIELLNDIILYYYQNK